MLRLRRLVKIQPSQIVRGAPIRFLLSGELIGGPLIFPIDIGSFGFHSSGKHIGVHFDRSNVLVSSFKKLRFHLSPKIGRHGS